MLKLQLQVEAELKPNCCLTTKSWQLDFEAGFKKSWPHYLGENVWYFYSTDALLMQRVLQKGNFGWLCPKRIYNPITAMGFFGDVYLSAGLH